MRRSIVYRNAVTLIAFLALFAATLAAQAQLLSGGPPAVSHWDGPYISLTGSNTLATVGADGSAGYGSTVNWANSPDFFYVPSGVCNIPCSTPYAGHDLRYDCIGSGTVNAYYVWVDGSGYPAPNAPSRVYILEDVMTRWRASPSGTGKAYDGWDDVPKDEENGQVVQGKHLVQRDGSSGIVSVSISMSSEAHTGDATIVGGSAWLQFGCRISLDNRGVFIDSSLGTTYYRGLDVNGLPVQIKNMLDLNGTMHGDTVRRDQGTFFNSNALVVDYTAHPQGAWNPYSSFSWINNGAGVDRSNEPTEGAFNPDPISIFLVLYDHDNADPSKAPGHVFIRLIDAASDSADPVTATANFYMKFHEKYEDWRETVPPVMHPADYVKGQINSDWMIGGSVQYTGSSAPGTTQQYSVKVSKSIKLTEAGTIETTVVVQATNEVGFANLQHKESITSTTEVTSSIEQTITVNLTVGYGARVYVAPLSIDKTGACSLWDIQGYVHECIWTGTQVPNVGGLQTMSFAIDQYRIDGHP